MDQLLESAWLLLQNNWLSPYLRLTWQKSNCTRCITGQKAFLKILTFQKQSCNYNVEKHGTQLWGQRMTHLHMQTQ